MSMLEVKAIKTRIYRQQEDFFEFLATHLSGSIEDGCIVAITSKVVSIAEGCVIAKSEIGKRELIEKEADVFLEEVDFGVCLTIKHGILIPSAGIDESNAEDGVYIVFPKDPYASAKKIHRFLCEKFGLRKLGILITDSHTHALRKGVTGIALSHYGLRATKNLVGQEDLFGRKLKMTSVNVIDSLAVAAVLMMGEANECQPLAIVKYDDAEFTTTSDQTEIQIPLKDDLYGPLIRNSIQKK